MEVIELHECECVGGGVAPVWGDWLGKVLGEVGEHPGVAFLGPIWGPIYLVSIH